MKQTSLGGRPIDIHSGPLRLRSLKESDLPLLLRWLTDQRVLAFYGGRDLKYDPDSLRAHYEEPIGDDYSRAIIEFESTPVGYFQLYRLSDEMRREYGYPQTDETVFAADQFIGVPELWDHGIGTDYLRLLLRYLARETGADVLLVDPHLDNKRAIHAYEKAGFHIVRELPAHELFEGKRVGCLLMAKRIAPQSHAGVC